MARISDTTLAQWFDHIADGLDAGMTASNAVSLSSGLPKKLGAEIARSLESGNTWTQATEILGTNLAIAEVAIVAAAEQSATLPQALKNLAAGRREKAKVRRRMALAAAYPMFLLHFAALVFSLEDLMNDSLQAFLRSVGTILVPVWGAILLFALVVKVWPRSLKVASRLAPLFSGYRKAWDLSILCKVLAASTRAGLPVDQSWEVATLAADDRKISRLGEAVQRAIRQGSPVSESFEEVNSGLPESFFQLYRSGELTGKLDENLDAAGDSYAKQARGKLFAASIAYPSLLLIYIFGYIGYKIIMFYKGYFDSITNISA